MTCDSPAPGRDGEAGSVLIEALVSAVVLLTAIVALYFALDVQTIASGNARASTVAAGLAETDQERLRSFRVPQLSNRHETRIVAVATDDPLHPVNYTVDSDVDWIRDATGGAQSCESSSTQADYLRLKTTVTAPATSSPRPDPITVSSLVAPPVGQFGEDQGTLAVAATGGAGQPIAGATTSISGPTTLSDSTNELGCAIFGFVPVGTYTASLSAAGFVDPSGNATATGSATATEGTVNLTTLQYDRFGGVDVSFDTQLGAAAAVQPALSTTLSAAHPGVPGTGFRLYRPGTAQSTISASKLFPFSTPYTLYAGACPAANPAQYDASYFSSHAGSPVVGPGSTAAVTVRVPALLLTVKTSAAAAAVHVRVRSIDGGCTDVFDWDVVSSALKSATLPTPGLPFGHYSVCASTGGKSITLPSVDLIDPKGSAPQTIDLGSGKGAVGGSCP